MLWVARVGEKVIFEISYVTLKIGPITLKLDDNLEIEYSKNIAIFNTSNIEG
jgi:hypothetical protein